MRLGSSIDRYARAVVRGCALALAVSTSGCTTVGMWQWARDRDDSEMSAYLDAEGRRIAVRLDRTGALWREYGLVPGWSETTGTAAIVASIETSTSPPAWLAPWLECSANATNPSDVFGREYLGSRNLVSIREGRVYAGRGDGSAVLVEDLYGPTNTAATVGAVFATPVTVAADVSAFMMVGLAKSGLFR